MYIKEIKTERFKIKKFSLNLVNNNYLNWFNDDEVEKFISFKPKNLPELKINVKDNLKRKNTVFLSISFKQKHIGNIKIHDINYNKNEAWIGILVGDKDFRGIGVTQEVIENIKTFLIKKKIYFLKLNVDKKNLPAIKSYLKSGFFIEKKCQNYLIMKCKLYEKKIILGLAQLQSAYGVTNIKKKKLSTKDSINILKKIDKSNISELDTAYSYPFKISLLKSIKKKILLNTKILSTDMGDFNKFSIYLKKIEKFKNIKINTVFVHDGNNLLSKNGKRILNKIEILKKKKLIKKIGVSFHNFYNFEKILNSYKIDVVQIPYSAVDRRGKKYFTYLKKREIEIQVRSIFLQGALLSKIKSNLKLTKIYNKIKEKKILDRLNILFSFILKDINIDKIVIGVRQVNELKMILNFNKLKINKILDNLYSNDLEIIDPLNWSELNYHEKK